MLLTEIRPRRVGHTEVLTPPQAGRAGAIHAGRGNASTVSTALSLPQAELLTRIDLFAHLDRVALARLAACADAMPVDTGQDVCRVGESADGLYVIAEGSFGVYLPRQPGVGETRVAQLRPGDFFGEMALLDDAPRSATVRAEGRGEVLRLERTRFEALLRKEPGIGLTVAVALSRRIRERERARPSDEELHSAPSAAAASTVSEGAVTVRHHARHRPISWRCLAGGVLAGTFGVGALAAHVAAAPPQAVFGLLMAAAIALWSSQLLPEFAVALGLVVAWLLLGVATPAQALAGFASLTWLFVLTVLALAGAVGRSGLMFRTGLLLVRRLPAGLIWQTTMLLLTGVLVSPLLPSTMGRAALTAPLALAVAEARRLRDHHPAAAALGLAAWIGSTPMTFAFLNASSLCLLAWGLLPDASRARFDWIHWLLAALPLTVLVAVGTVAMLFVVLRPKSGSGATHQQLQVQLSVLGPLSPGERAMIGVLLFTLVGWLLAPLLGIDVALVGILGVVAAVATGNLDRRGLQELDWNFLVLFGVILSATGLVGGLGVDRDVAAGLGASLGRLGLAPWTFVAMLVVVGALVEVALGKTQMVLVLGLALIPAAAAIGVEPWVVIITLVAGPSLWFLPGQAPAYLVAQAAAEDRLYTRAQSRSVALGYALVTLLAVVLSVPYWHFLGLL
jgi:CRP-like cAMP-binding protein/di/tricarboxylate transporter